MRASLAAGVVAADDLSTGWLQTVLAVDRSPGQKLFHTVTRISQPGHEESDVRARCDQLLSHLGHPGVETVANTIFPAALAACTAGPDELFARYRALYPTLRRFPANKSGTYFGRMIQRPGLQGEVNQLARVMATLTQQLRQRGPMSTPYEMTLDETTDPVVSRDDASAAPKGTPAGLGADGEDTATVLSPSDRRVRGFPCMSFLSFQLDGHQLHAFAHYRYEFLIEKGYGNYLGIARLHRYVSEQVGVEAGALTLTSGRAHVDAPSSRVRRYLHETPLFI